MRQCPARSASPAVRKPPVLRRASWCAIRFLLATGGLTALGAAAGAELRVQVLDAAGRPLDDAVVFLESDAARRAARPMADVEISQQRRQFVPATTVVTAGTAVRFPNRDTVRHHVYSFSAVKPFEIKLYSGVPANPVIFDRPGIAVLGCNIHDQMVAWVVVLDTPYHARSSADGMAVLRSVPGGVYRLRGWHADLPAGAPADDQPLSLAGDGVATIRLAVAPGSSR